MRGPGRPARECDANSTGERFAAKRLTSLRKSNQPLGLDLHDPKYSYMTSTRSTFFRQSGWMIVATTTSGVFMYVVHVVAASKMDSAEYAVFATLIKVFLLLSFPAIGLQVIFTQQAAAAVSEPGQRQVAAAARAALRGTFL